ncbi:hypothetical protein LOC67_22955 [Stieleria sp. JC731]|uniref:hypothetical protein n=1 Tax=Pirellulaceae TaxID=2691357 RepID=UPI001E598534|nr:hypothetical protein [Stieleria sp. JC731]MCC9603418.1 hypothetical protein [Stieleria sp. JC731]
MPAAAKTKRTRSLTDKESGKVWGYTLQGLEATIESGTAAKPRQRAKKFSTADQANDYLVKEEWKKLKAGYTLQNPDAKPGEPLHRVLLGGASTGQLPLVQVGEDLLTTRYDASTDSLVKLTSSGSMSAVAQVPKQSLVLDLCSSAETQRLCVNADHHILAWDPAAPKKFNALNKGKAAPASCMAVGGRRIALYDAPNIVVQDVETSDSVMAIECKPESYGGHTPQLCVALTQDGNQLAVCSKSGMIDVYRVDDGTKIGDIQADFQFIEELQFDSSGTLLVGNGQYGPWGPIFFDLKSMSRIDPPIKLPSLSDGATHFALHPERRMFAVTSMDQLTVFDLDQPKPKRTIVLEHVVKNSGVGFWGDDFAVRTDLGCLTVYRI